MKNKLARQYMRRVHRCFPDVGKYSRSIIRQLEMDVQLFLTEHPECSYEELVGRFGSPESIVEDCLREADSSKLAKELGLRQKTFRIVTAGVLIVLVMWGAVVLWAALRYSSSMNGYYVEEIIDGTWYAYEDECN